MTANEASTSASTIHSPAAERWLNAAAVVAALGLALPVITIAVLAFTPTENVWPHLMATVLPGYIRETLLLLAGVGIMTFVLGTSSAWLVTMCRFPLRRVFQWASLVPMAAPGYIVAYAYVDFLSYAGPLQSKLRELAGWQRPDDYWFPEIRSLGGAIFVMSMVLYPYVFLTARASFIRQPGTQLEVAAMLGVSDSLVSDYRRRIETNLQQLSFTGVNEARQFEQALKRKVRDLITHEEKVAA